MTIRIIIIINLSPTIKYYNIVLKIPINQSRI